MNLLNASTDTNVYWVVHPLDDLLEEKRDPSGLGPMPMTLSVRLSLFTLRAYLILMTFWSHTTFSALPPRSGICRAEAPRWIHFDTPPATTIGGPK